MEAMSIWREEDEKERKSIGCGKGERKREGKDFLCLGYLKERKKKEMREHDNFNHLILSFLRHAKLNWSCHFFTHRYVHGTLLESMFLVGYLIGVDLNICFARVQSLQLAIWHVWQCVMNFMFYIGHTYILNFFKF